MLLPVFVSSAFAATLNVGTSGDYVSISAAVSAASVGDTIIIAAGDYPECVDLGGEELTLIGADTGLTTVNGVGCATGAFSLDTDSDVVIKNMTIKNTGQSAIVVDAGELEMEYVTVLDSGSLTPYQNGGGIYANNGASIEISNSTFQGNSGDVGGGIYLDSASTLQATSVIFLNNHGQLGGGIGLKNNSSLDLHNCEFDGNVASYNGYGKGGAIYGFNIGVVIDHDSSYDTNTAITYGGAISVDNSSTPGGELYIFDSEFTGNYLQVNPSSGGAIYAYKLDAFTVEGSTFTTNDAYLYGGALFISEITNPVTVDDCDFVDNWVDAKQGGAISVVRFVNATISSSTFSNNTAGEAGGGVAVNDSSSLTIEDSTFTGNQNFSTQYAYGGGVFIFDEDAGVETLTVTGSTFSSNISSLGGGGLYAGGLADVTVSSSVFEQNTAGNIENTTLHAGGGGFFVDLESLTVSNTTACANLADYGGGFAVQNVTTATWNNNTIQENIANEDGGGVWFINHSAVDFMNNTLVGNIAENEGGGGFFDEASAVTFTNNIVAYGSSRAADPPSGGGVYAKDATSASTTTVTYSDFYGNTPSNTGGYFAFSTSDNGNLTAVPGFIEYSQDGDCGNDDLTLAVGSTLVNAGDPSLIDPDGTTSDIGAYGGAGSTVYDSDGDGYYNTVDCNDEDDTVYPGAMELCNGLDNDCDGQIDIGAGDGLTWYPDGDQDGYGSGDNGESYCSAPEGYVSNSLDCDDQNATVFPDADEYCDGLDNDCDDQIDEDGALNIFTWYADNDQDGYGDLSNSEQSCDELIGYVSNGEDCDDSDADVYPGAAEHCDGEDDDCDGVIDEEDAVDVTTWYVDEDGDGFGVLSTTMQSCGQPQGYSGSFDDCDDTDANTNPGADEQCDGRDNDCDDETDEDQPEDATTWHLDLDGDGYGAVESENVPGCVLFPASQPDEIVCATVISCEQVQHYESNNTDCDDEDSAINPNGVEQCDGADNDCDGQTDEDTAVDITEWFIDADGDEYGSAITTIWACNPPGGYVDNYDDCDDSNAAISPSADEACNTVDDDCDGELNESDAIDVMIWFIDEDGDQYGDDSEIAVACEAPAGFVSMAGDCDDEASEIHPAAVEICDGIDNNCDGQKDGPNAEDASLWYLDLDQDGFGTQLYENNVGCVQYEDADADTVICEWVASCSGLPGYVPNSGDCDDSDLMVNPDQHEVCDDVDNDCNGEIDEATALDAVMWYADIDDDGFGDPEEEWVTCEADPAGYVLDGTDCNDADSNVNPGAQDTPYDWIDNDCDGMDIIDVDGDGHAALSVGGDDCDDEDDSVNPSTVEIVGDDIDQNCDGVVYVDSSPPPQTSWSCATSGHSGGQHVGLIWSVLLVLWGLMFRRTDLTC